MAIITKIEDQKNKKRFNIFVDNAFFCGLMKETAILAGLKVGREIDEQELNKLVFDSEVKMAFEKASSYLASREHSKKELTDKLLKKGYAKEVVAAACEKLEEYHYVDDALFAKHFAQQNSKYSRVMLENKLKQKGIANEIIDDALSEIEDDDELKLCEKYAKKYVASKDMTKEGAKEKLFASLARRGFKFDIIKKAIKKFWNDNDIDLWEGYYFITSFFKKSIDFLSKKW